MKSFSFKVTAYQGSHTVMTGMCVSQGRLLSFDALGNDTGAYHLTTTGATAAAGSPIRDQGQSGPIDACSP